MITCLAAIRAAQPVAHDLLGMFNLKTTGKLRENRYNGASFGTAAEMHHAFLPFMACWQQQVFLTRPVRLPFSTTSEPDALMKLHPNSTQQYQTVTGYDHTGVEINAKHYDYSLLVLPEMAPQAWPVARFDDLTEAHFAQILADSPDVVILGTGARQRFVHPRLTTALTMRRIGVECMDSQAACRTYNILMGEGRKVTLALIIDASDAGPAA